MPKTWLLWTGAILAIAAGGWARARTGTRTAVRTERDDAAPASSSPAWLRFGFDPQSSGSSPDATGITAANVAGLHRTQVTLPGTADSSPVYLHGATVNGATHDVLFLTTSYGKTVAVDARSGSILWTYTPDGYDSWSGSRQITNATPLADADRNFIYAASPDGHIQKLAVSDGHRLWSTAITLLPEREKIPSSLNVDHGRIIATTDGYIGDRLPYQGHLVELDPTEGAIQSVFNSLCSNVHALLQPSSCPQSDSGIWGRAGAVVDPGGNIWVATGNAEWDGKIYWGDSVIELNSNATTMLGNYTPADTEYLNDRDLDLGSTSPVLLGDGLVAQGGKDAKIRLLSVNRLAGTAPHRDDELQIVDTPGGGGTRDAMLFTAPAVWRNGGETWMFVADGAGTAAWQLVNRQLVQRWNNANAGTSPVIAGGLLFIYDPQGGLRVYQPRTGEQVADLACGPGHWNSPVVIDGHIALPEGNANQRQTTGILDIWSVR